jgi:DNA ligase (NAD+)
LVCTYPSQVKTLHQRWLDGQLFTSYPTDGIVVKVYDHDLQRKMGVSNGAKPCPHWALALKR